MIPVTGIFHNRADALESRDILRSRGIPEKRIAVLMPGQERSVAKQVAVTDTEPPGIGKAMGGVVGAALGAAGGAELGAIAASLLVPGVGPVLAIGALGAALFGIGGAIGGAVIGETLDEALTEGLPIDELFFYEDALRKGHALVVVFAENENQAETARQLLSAEGAESIDAARENWWLGIRDDEKARFEGTGRGDSGESEYREGFETALSPKWRGRPYEDVRKSLQAEGSMDCEGELFKRGYERGCEYLNQQQQSNR